MSFKDGDGTDFAICGKPWPGTTGGDWIERAKKGEHCRKSPGHLDEHDDGKGHAWTHAEADNHSVWLEVRSWPESKRYAFLAALIRSHTPCSVCDKPLLLTPACPSCGVPL